MGEILRQFLESHGITNPLWLVLTCAAFPGIEARYAIPLGLALKLPIWQLLAITVPANVLIVVPVLLWFDPIARRFGETRCVGPVIQWLLRRARKREKLVEKYGVFALTVFVAIPLPVTGAWTGSLIAVVFGMSFWRSVACMLLGVLGACTITIMLYYAGGEAAQLVTP